MSHVEETAFDKAFYLAELIKAREKESGGYGGDGPTMAQIDTLIANLIPVAHFPDEVACSRVWDAFRSAVETEMTWLFPERDALGKPMTQILREIQEITGKGLEQVDMEWKPRLEKFVNVHLIANAAKRQVQLRGNNISWRLVLARLLKMLGMEKPAVSLANSEFKTWKK